MKCILNCFKKGIFKTLGKIKRILYVLVPEKNGGLSRIRIIWFYLNYIDKFTPKNSISFSLVKLSFI